MWSVFGKLMVKLFLVGLRLNHRALSVFQASIREQLCSLLFTLFDLPFSKLDSVFTRHETGKTVFYQEKVK